MKLLLTTAAILAATTFAAGAASIERVGAKVNGESTWVPAVRFVSPRHGAVTITTETYADGRAIEGAEIAPAGSFDPTRPASAIAYIQARFGVTPGLSLGGSVNAYTTVTVAGDDGLLGTEDDETRRKAERDHDGW